MWSCVQNLVTLAFLREKLSKLQFYKDLTRKTYFFEEGRWLKFNNLGLALGMALKFYTSVTKGLKRKSQKVLGVNSYICRCYKGKTCRGKPFCPPSPSPIPHLILNRINGVGDWISVKTTLVQNLFLRNSTKS